MQAVTDVLCYGTAVVVKLAHPWTDPEWMSPGTTAHEWSRGGPAR
jgi:hypothetical protein